jgi:glyoxylase-like metal-dependent hydrolase (beta-lactamase superfamily II)
MATETLYRERLSSGTQDGLMEVAADVAGMTLVMVNVYFAGEPGSGDWVLIDAGLPMSASRIRAAAERRFGEGAKPKAIILTHGHFDHVGALRALTEAWDVPIYAHELELPFLTGESDYPPPDPGVGGGIMAATSFVYPRGAYDFRPRIQALPSDGTVPHLHGWRWIHTPGHSPGHVSFFRESDRMLIAGDAITTQKQESFFGVMTQHQHVHGPPMYFTIDWESAKHSVQTLARLQPSVAATGHGIPMFGEQLNVQLIALALHFEELGMPSDGRYVREPARSDEHGVQYIPPATIRSVAPKVLAGVLLAAGVATLISTTRRRD